MKFKASEIIDGILIFISFFVFTFLAVGYFTKNVWVLLSVAVCVSLFAVFLIRHKSGKKKKIDPLEEKYLMQFVCFGKKYYESIIYSALKKRYEISEKDGINYINGRAVAICISLVPMTEEKLAELYCGLNNAEKIVMITGLGFNKKANEFLSILPAKIKVLKFHELYNLLKSLDALPKLELNFKKNKPGFKKIICEALKAERAKGFFTLALFLAATSFFTPFSIYSIVVAGINLLLGALATMNLGEKIFVNKKQ